MSTPRRIEIYDTTLRDGTQGEGFNLSLQDKLSIAKKLDDLGVDYIEGGFPLSNPKDEAFFRDVKQLKLKNAKVAAFGMTRRRGVTAAEDAGMNALLAAETPRTGEVWNLGSGRPQSVNRLVELLGGPVVYIPRRPGEPEVTWADIGKVAVPHHIGVLG